jgi:hypothetical protein
MIAGYLNYSQLENGQLFDENRSSKGILRPALKELEGSVVIEQTGETRGLDWYGLEQGNRAFRWSGPNPRPKILIPYAYSGEVEITLCIPFESYGSAEGSTRKMCQLVVSAWTCDTADWG